MLKGKVEIIESFFMPELNRHRNLRIYLPPKYETNNESYPVLYMHDAQNLYDEKTSSFGHIWDIGAIMDAYYQEHGKGMIVVGIDNGKELRYNEYSPWKDEEIVEIMPHAKKTNRYGGEGFLYVDFIVNTLKHYIDSKYRTLRDRDNTSISGSSMGGLISLAAGIRYQNIFSKIAAFSSALFFAEEEMKTFVSNTKKQYDMKIYMDIGTNETSNLEIEEFPKLYFNTNKELVELLKDSGFNNLKFIIDEGASHNEVYWNKRFPKMMDWLYE